jgi:RES domain-containing protein
MLRGWRLVKSRYAAAAFDGEGARRYGGRWNSPGTRVAYASNSVALATLEVLVHLRSSAVLQSYSLASVQFPESLLEVVEVHALPRHWRRSPAPPETQALGDEWVRDLRSAVLAVPSVVVPSAQNFLLNPAHPDFAKVRIEPPEPFELDPRIAGA